MAITSYARFIRDVQKWQRASIQADRRKMLRAERLWRLYKAAMWKLGFHALTGEEIAARLRELDQMEANIEKTHRDGPTMRWAYENQRDAA